jgi:hypothetical protein
MQKAFESKPRRAQTDREVMFQTLLATSNNERKHNADRMEFDRRRLGKKNQKLNERGRPLKVIDADMRRKIRDHVNDKFYGNFDKLASKRLIRLEQRLSFKTKKPCYRRDDWIRERAREVDFFLAAKFGLMIIPDPGFVFEHYDEPYGNKFLINCRYQKYVWSDYNGNGFDEFMRHRIESGLGYVTGTIFKGGTTSRLFHATHFRDMAGKQWTVDCVSRGDLERGYKRTVAM